VFWPIALSSQRCCWAISFRPMTPIDTTSDSVWCRLRSVHWISWLAGGVVALSAVRTERPLFLVQPFIRFSSNYVDLLFDVAESLILVVSAVCVVDRVLQTIRSRRFSLSDLFVAVTAVCLVVWLMTYQYRWSQRLHELAHRPPYPDYAYPPLVDERWSVRLPLVFGVACLCYLFIDRVSWAFRSMVLRCRR